MNYNELRKKLALLFPEKNRPTLELQFQEWSDTKPLKGVKILDATPSFYNTQLKYVNLLAAGADLTIGLSKHVPHDKEAIKSLSAFNIPIEYFDLPRDSKYDIILDCGAIYRQRDVTLGFVELTRSGALHFQNCKNPVFNADDSLIKELETSLGTGESFVRAMRYKNYPIEGRKFIIFGYGKVGRGIAMFLYEAGAEVCVVDDLSKVYVPKQITAVDLNNRSEIQQKVDEAYCVISVSGIPSALDGLFDLEKAMASDTVLVNMGVENEFGPKVNPARVLNNNFAFNFILEQPTLLPYLDPTMALHNAGAVELLNHRCQIGLNTPSAELTRHYLNAVYKANIISAEIERMNQWKTVS